MSRAYRIRRSGVTVRAAIDREVTASDEICSQLEVIDVLPREQMAALLAAELEKRGFERREDGSLQRERFGATETVNPNSGEVRLRIDSTEEVHVAGAKAQPPPASAQDEISAEFEQQLRQELREELAVQAQHQHEQRTSERLEQAACALGHELDQVVSHATAEALKQKAAGMGQIRQIDENADTGSLTIIVEV